MALSVCAAGSELRARMALTTPRKWLFQNALRTERGILGDAALNWIMQVNFAQQLTHVCLSIPTQCPDCGFKGVYRPGQISKCMYCGEELYFDASDEASDKMLASLDAAKLFDFTVKGPDITDDFEFNAAAAQIFTMPDTIVKFRANECGGKYYMVQSNADKVAGNSKITEVRGEVAAYQKKITRICLIMLSMWKFISASNPKAGSILVKEFLTIAQAKKQNTFDALYAPIICEKCHAEQWPATLFRAKCSECSEPFPAKLLPGLMLMQKDSAAEPAAYTQKERKLEYLYNLFEALFRCAGAAFDLTLDDLAKTINGKILPPGTEDSKYVCPSCLHSVVSYQIIRSQCPYCKTDIGELLPENAY